MSYRWSLVLLALGSALLPGCRGRSDAARQPAVVAPAAYAPAPPEPDPDQAVKAAQALLPPAPPKGAATPGVAVLDPGGAGEAEFGRGCARWLHVALGSYLQLGSTPLLTSCDRARREMRRADLAIPAGDRSTFAAHAGASHLLVTRLDGSEPNLTLALQWSTAQGKEVGKAVTLRGSKADLARQLPDAAKTLATTLAAGKPVAPLPAPEPETLATAGRWWWFDPQPGTNSAPEGLGGARPAPLLRLLGLRLDPRGRTPDIARELVAAFPDNALVLGELGYRAGQLLPPFKARVGGLRAANPQSHALAQTEVWVRRLTHEAALEAAAAQDAVAAAPRNPDAWLSLAWTTSVAANRIRNGRFAGQLSASEWAQLEPLYTRWERAAAAAAAVDPDYARAWNRIAQAATFAGNAKLADAALWAALKLEPDNHDHYQWGLQIYQPKWFDDPAKLADLKKRIMARDWNLDFDGTDLLENMKSAGMDAEATELANRWTAKLETAIAARPEDGAAQYYLGLLYRWQGNPARARSRLKEAVRLIPENADAHLKLARNLEDAGQTDGAVAEYRAGLKLDPTNADAHFDLGWAFKDARRYPEARQEFGAALRIDPTHSNAHYGLAMLHEIAGDKRQAEKEYRLAVRVPAAWECYRNLSILLSDRKQFEEAVLYANKAIELKPEDLTALNSLAYAYGTGGKPRECAEVCRKMLEINPADPVARVNLGEALCQMGERAEGRREMLQARASGDPQVVKEADRLLRKYP